MTIHVGRGTTRGAMTVFPLWHDAGPGHEYTVSVARLEVTEVPGTPEVSTLMAVNHGPVPVLVPDGQLFDAGWQHRMALASLLLAPGELTRLPVACVEAGRWGGSAQQRGSTRRAAPSVREGGRVSQPEVWRRVARHTDERPNATSSLVQHMDDAAPPLTDLRPLPGQAGVLIGLGGQPYVAELFDSPETLAAQLPAVLEAAQLDAALLPAEPTPGRRARRFVSRLVSLSLWPGEAVGLGRSFEGESEHVRASILRWSDADLHTRASNVRRPVLAA